MKILSFNEFNDVLTESETIRNFNQKVLDNVAGVMAKYKLEVADMAPIDDMTMEALKKNTNKIDDKTLLDALSKQYDSELSGKLVADIFN